MTALSGWSRGGTRVLVLAAAATMFVTACSSEGKAEGPIVVSSVNTLSGPIVLADPSEAAKAVFDEYNAAGGLNGRKIEYSALDDKTDPGAASSAARDATNRRGAVALVGSTSNVDCAVNSRFYAQAKIGSIPGLGTDPFCFNDPSFSPTNTGPFLGAELTLGLADDQLALNKICAVIGVGGGAQDAFETSFKNWSERSGKELAWVEFIPYGSPDFTPYVIRAKKSGCDGLLFNGGPEQALALMNASKAQAADFTYLFFTSAYTDKFAAAAPKTGKGVYIVAEYAPYTDVKNAATADWRRVMEKHNVPLTSFAQGGYLAAKYFIQALEGIEGDITRQSVTEALKTQKSAFKNPMVGTPWMFGPGRAHASNTAGWPVVLRPGASTWEDVTGGWLTLKSTSGA